MTKFIAPECLSCPSRNNQLLGCCHADEMALIAGSKWSQEYAKGEIIFREGLTATGLYCVHSGKIKVIKSSGEGKEQIVRLAKGGDMLGYHSLLAGLAYSATAVALEPCVVCHIPRADFFRVWQSNLQFAAALMQMMAKSLRDAEVRLLHLAYKPVRERVAEALVLLYHTFSTADDTQPFAISIARDDLAALVGTAKETATRLLSDLKDEGIIATRGSQVTILKIKDLTRIASLYD